ncbi:MAG: transposase [Bacteroidetes bacterium]|nr:transposase [Bacteroidota bacterium]
MVQKRWQIETTFKSIKQNYQLKYFLGDSENAIRIQIWCSLIADLLIKVVKKSVKKEYGHSLILAL